MVDHDMHIPKNGSLRSASRSSGRQSVLQALRLVAILLVSAGLALFAHGAKAAECGDVTIAEMNWASAGIAANIDKIILEEGFGCHVTLVAGDTMPSFASMAEHGEPDIIPELWINAVRIPLEKAVAEGRLIEAGRILRDGGKQGWYIPRFLADEHPEIRTVQDALKHPELFPSPENPSRAAVFNCPAGWNCQTTTENLFKALGGATQAFDLVDSGSAAGLDGSIAKAFSRKTGWIGYYWEPTALMGQYEMVKLGFGTTYDKGEFLSCTVVPDCPAPKLTEYPASEVYSVVTKAFAEKAGPAMHYIAERNYDNDTVNKVLAWAVENQAGNADAAVYFLKTFPDIWQKWIPKDVAEKVMAMIASRH